MNLLETYAAMQEEMVKQAEANETEQVIAKYAEAAEQWLNANNYEVDEESIVKVATDMINADLSAENEPANEEAEMYANYEKLAAHYIASEYGEEELTEENIEKVAAYMIEHDAEAVRQEEIVKEAAAVGQIVGQEALAVIMNGLQQSAQ